jgi:hypothetical protein
VSPGFPTDNPAVKAIPLRQNFAPDGQVCTVSGWGYLRDEDLDLPQMLQVVVVPFITYDTCRYFYQNITDGSIEPGMNCAGYLQGGKDACGVSTGSLFAAQAGLCLYCLRNQLFLIQPDYALLCFQIMALFLRIPEYLLLKTNC